MFVCQTTVCFIDHPLYGCCHPCFCANKFTKHEIQLGQTTKSSFITSELLSCILQKAKLCNINVRL